MKVLTGAFCLVPVALMGLAAQQRDAPAQVRPTPTATIAGRVVTDEATPRPVRRAIVDCSNRDDGVLQSAVTDDDGRFRCGPLPSGRFLVTARKAAHLDASYGASRPGRPGTALSLVNDQQIDITIRMFKGAVLTGVIRERSGRLAVAARVTVTNARPSERNSPRLSPTGSGVTDDTGTYRIYGLQPGEYILSAVPRITGTGATGARSVPEMDAALAQIALRARLLATPASTPQATTRPTPIPPAPSVGFAPTFYPGTPIGADAGTIALAAGEERSGLDFQIAPVRAATVQGVISGPIPNLAVTQISILPAAQGWFSASESNPILVTRPAAQDGTFRFINVTPGHYTITARADRQKTTPDPITGLGGSSSSVGVGGNLTSGPSGDFLYAVAGIDVSGDDVLGLDLALQPGAVIAGRIEFDASTAKPPDDLTKIRVGVYLPGPFFSLNMNGTLLGTQLNSVPGVQVQADGTFTVSSIGPGTYLFREQLPGDLASVWSLRSVVVGGRDVVDAPLEMIPGRGIADMVVTLSDRQTELSGNLQGASGVPATEYFVVAFPVDRTFWRAGTRRIQSVRPASDGRFTIKNLPAGEYYLAALTDVEPADLGDRKFLDQVVPASLKIALAYGEKKTQDLRIAR